MDVSDYYSKSFDLFKDNLNMIVPALVGIVSIFVISIITALIVLVLSFGLQSSLTGGIISGTNFEGFSLASLVIIGLFVLIIVMLSLVISAFMYAATIGMAKKVIKGKGAELDVAWKKGKKYFIKVFAVNIVMSLIFGLLSLPIIVGLILLSSQSNTAIIVTAIGALIFIVGGIFFGLSFFVVNQSIVIGKKSIIGSLKDSYKVFWKNKLKVFLVALINFAVSFGISFVLGFIPFIGSFLNLIVSIFLIPYFALVLTYLYMDINDKIPLQPEY